MIPYFCWPLALCQLVGVLAVTSRALQLRGNESEGYLRREISNQDTCIPCHITRVQTFFDEETGAYACFTGLAEQGVKPVYDIVLSNRFLRDYESAIDSGNAYFCIPERYLDITAGVIVLPAEFNGGQFFEPGRRIEQTNPAALLSGTKRLLAVRITTSFGEAPTETAAEMEAAIFGTASDPSLLPTASVVEQYNAVSHGALNLVPAIGNGVVNGVVEVRLQRQVQGVPIQGGLAADILSATASAVGSLDQVADRFIFCLPNYSLLEGRDTWTAFAYLFEPYSFYQMSRCTKLSVAMHELGHSFGFRHSGVGTNDYGDETCYMGYAVNQFGSPRKAFNAHKHWLSGWFSDRSMELDALPADGLNGRLVSFVDYGHSDLLEGDFVLLRFRNLFLHYNRAKGYNVDLPEPYRDRVVVTQADGPLNVSMNVATLGSGESLRLKFFSGSHDLVISVCGRVADPFDYVLLSLYLDNGAQSSLCDASNSFVVGSLPESEGAPRNNASGIEVEDGSTIRQPKRSTIAAAVVWTVVGLLLGLCLFMLVRYRLQGINFSQRNPSVPNKPPDSQTEGSLHLSESS